jgi:hypothetical protein
LNVQPQRYCSRTVSFHIVFLLNFQFRTLSGCRHRHEDDGHYEGGAALKQDPHAPPRFQYTHTHLVNQPLRAVGLGGNLANLSDRTIDRRILQSASTCTPRTRTLRAGNAHLRAPARTHKYASWTAVRVRTRTVKHRQ